MKKYRHLKREIILTVRWNVLASTILRLKCFKSVRLGLDNYLFGQQSGISCPINLLTKVYLSPLPKNPYASYD